MFVVLILFTVASMTASDVCDKWKSEKLLRVKRASTTLGKFSSSDLETIGLVELLNFGPDINYNFNQILQALQNFHTKIDSVNKSLKYLLVAKTIRDAEEIEREILALVELYSTLTKAIRDEKQNGRCGCRLMSEVEDLNDNLKDIPSMLFKLSLIFRGESIAGGGRTSGLICEYIEYSYRQLSSSYTNNDLITVSNNLDDFFDTLMEFQAQSFQLYETTCSTKNTLCEIQKEKMEDHLIEQSKLINQCKVKYKPKERSPVRSSGGSSGSSSNKYGSGSPSINSRSLLCCVIGVLVHILF